jgi:hypothetical protein
MTARFSLEPTKYARSQTAPTVRPQFLFVQNLSYQLSRIVICMKRAAYVFVIRPNCSESTAVALRVEVGRVGNVKHLRAEFQVCILRQFGFLLDAQIRLEEPGGLEKVFSG